MKLIIVIGATASGKTDYAIDIAKKHSSPIISCDSRQIYSEMRIGTAPPDEQQLSETKHYFIHSHSIHEPYTAGRYEVEALDLLENLFKSHSVLVAVGGSGLYIDALYRGLDNFPAADLELRAELTRRLESEGIESLRAQLKYLDRESYDTIEIANSRRILRALEVIMQTGRKFSSFKTGTAAKRPFEIEMHYLSRDRGKLYERIDKRVDKMVETGLIREAYSLFEYRDLTALRTVGYSELFSHFKGEISLDEAIDLIKRNSRRYAKRQITWWNRYNNKKEISL